MLVLYFIITILTILSKNVQCFVTLPHSSGNMIHQQQQQQQQQPQQSQQEHQLPPLTDLTHSKFLPPVLLPPFLSPLSSSFDNNLSNNDVGRLTYYEPTEGSNESEEYDIQQTGGDVANIFRKLENDIKHDQDIASKSVILIKMLEDPNLSTLPIVYVENEPLISSDENVEDDNFSPSFELEKRSRYYRRYPGKRHSRNRSTYEPDMRYLCVPSREDVFKLLIGIHENRNGNQRKTVQFCNRKRPAKAIFTNIRFLG